MDFNTDLGQVTKLSARLTVLAMAVALAACGGGGASDAVTASPSNGNGNTNQPAASQYALTLSTDKPSINISGDTVTITATALEKIGGGRVSGQSVQLLLPDPVKNGLSLSGPSKVETDELGQAVFVLQLKPNSTAEQQALLTKGLDLEAVLVEANGAQVRQRTVVNVVQPGTQVSPLNLDIFTDKQVANVNGDTVAVTLRASDSNAGGVAAQRVILSIPNGLRGVLIDGASESVTDSAGNAVFNIKIAENLTAAETTELLKGISLVARLIDSSGAEKLASRLLTVQRPSAQYNISVRSDAPSINAFGGEVTINVQASALNSASVEGQTVTVALGTGTPTGVQFDGNTSATTNAQGIAQFKLKVVAGLSQQAIDALLSNPIAIGATLTERSGAQVSSSLLVPVVKPSVQNSIRLDVTKNALLSTGDTMQIIATVLDKNNGAVEAQNVTLRLEATNGVVIEGPATIQTDEKGLAVFNIRLNDKLSAAERDALVSVGVKATATLVESTGASVSTPTRTIVVSQSGTNPVQAIYTPEISLSKTRAVISRNGDAVTVTVRAKDKNGGTVAGQQITLGLPANIEGMLIDGPSIQMTNEQGLASFVVRVSDQAAVGDVALNVTLTEPNGAISAASKTLKLELPVATLTPSISLSRISVSVDGGAVDVSVRALNANGGGVANQQVTLSLPSNSSAAVIDGESTLTTNAQGVATFRVLVKAGTTPQNIGLGAVITEASGAISSAAVASIVVEDPAADYSIALSSSGQINVLGGQVEILAKMSSQFGASIAGKTVTLGVPALPAGLSLDRLSTTTNAAGEAKFVLTVSPNLSTTVQDQLLAGGLAFTALFRQSATVQIQSPVLQATAVKPASQYQLSLTATKSRINVLGDTLVVTTQATNIQGGDVEDQPVTLTLSPQLAGVAIQGASTVRTDEQGQAQFVVSIAGLSATNRAALLQSGLEMTAKLTESNGASRTVTQTFETFEPTGVSNLNLAVRLNHPQINILGDQVEVTILASTPQGIAAAGRSVTIGLPALAGLNLTSEPAVVTSATGQAKFTLELSSTLSTAERAVLLANGLPISATLTEASGAIKTVSQTIPAFEPVASYQLSLVSSANPLNVRGGTATIRLQVLDSDLKAVATRPVKVWLSAPDNNASLLSLNGQPANLLVDLQTSVQGIAEYQIAIPSGLTSAQRNSLLQGITANAIVIEQNGARNVLSQPLAVAEPTSNLSLALQATKQSLNAAVADGFDVLVSLRDADNRAVSGQQLSFAISDVALRLGVRVTETTANTDSNGNAKFTVQTPAGLDVSALNGLLTYAVSLSASNGAIVTQTGMMSVVQPTARYSLRLNADKIVKTSGDTFKVFAQAVDGSGNPVANQNVQLLVNDPIRTGVTVISDPDIATDTNGLAVFDLQLTPGANVDQLLLSAGIGLSARLTEDNGVQSRQALIVPVDTLNTTGQYLLSWTQSKSAFTGFGDEISLTYRVTDANGGVLVGVPVALSIQNALVSGATLGTSSRLVSDANGLVTTTVRLTGRDLDAIIGNNVVVVNAAVQAASFNAQGVPTVTTLASQSVTLAKGGGAEFTLESSRSVMRAGESTIVTAKLVDGDGAPVQNAPVEFIDEITGVAFRLGTLVTGADGKVQASLAFSQLAFNADGRVRISAVVRGSSSELRAEEAIEIVSASDAMFSFIDLPNDTSAVDTEVPVTLRVRAATAAELSGVFILNTSLGRVSAVSGVAPTSNQVSLTLNGTADGVENGMSFRDITVFVSSAFPGIAVLSGSYQRAGQAAVERVVADIRLRAVAPAKMLLQADQTVLVPGQSTRVVAIVKDANDSPVGGAVVRFERLVDTSAGRLSAATATTNDAGVASVTYTAGTSAPLNRVEIGATIDAAPSVRPQPDKLTLTVAQQAAFITVGNSDRLAVSDDNIYYYHPYSMAVVDGSGRPVPNQPVSVQLFASKFSKGNFVFAPPSSQVIGGVAIDVPSGFIKFEQSCDTEDQNRNFTLDLVNATPGTGEDRNGNGLLEISNPIAIVADNVVADANGVVTFVTDEEGKFDFNIRYSKIYAEWARFEMKATTRVFGSETASVTTQSLPVRATDVDDTEGTRPNMLSPFGQVLSCNSPN